MTMAFHAKPKISPQFWLKGEGIWPVEKSDRRHMVSGALRGLECDMHLRGFGLSIDRLSTALARFRRDEEGALVYFTILLFLLMIMMGGIAVDAMRYEQRRTNLQSTLDRSTLAAASMTQDLDPETVVRDYFDKAGLTPYLTKVTVTEGMNFRNVKAQAKADAEPMFLGMLGIEDFQAKAVSVAEQRINNVEIVLVLDVSGSMGDPMSSGGSKIAALITAAKEFVSTVRANDSENRVSISIVPFNAQVNIGPDLIAKYNAQYPHGTANSNCLELPASSFASTGISRTDPISYVTYADTANSSSQSNNNYVSVSSGAASSFFCPVSTKNIVRLPQNDVATLQNYIGQLTDDGNTSIALGMKWGLALLDPNARPMFQEFITAGKIPGTMAGRPFDWDDDEAMKVIVVMTDGEHVAHDVVNDAYKSGLSPIYKSSDGYYSIHHTSGRPTAAGSNEYWVPHLCTSSTCRTTTNTSAGWRSTPFNSGVQQTWAQVWASQRVTWVAWQLYARALGTTSSTRTDIYDTWMENFEHQYQSVTSLNSLLQQSCTLAKNNGVIVYGIAFEAPSNGQTQISSCATSPSHYFNAQGMQIQTAFRAIANNISQLRLMQ
ncbi:pilus assembly protein TadG-related protein [Neotabrizicola shimadae]|uniref:VWA domain-containing protein n=1 Tax=Neotabrizicola shimadae TaxID=2807096 RepID=A0A8G0ZUS3_9RHOB|nr:pilus assembly protein TadG-related protein [Neotabrizicola shimadae]QYZ70503.1 VWA domain-containing protein [Neotabrizicola shimadae]